MKLWAWHVDSRGDVGCRDYELLLIYIFTLLGSLKWLEFGGDILELNKYKRLPTLLYFWNRDYLQQIEQNKDY